MTMALILSRRGAVRGGSLVGCAALAARCASPPPGVEGVNPSPGPPPSESLPSGEVIPLASALVTVPRPQVVHRVHSRLHPTTRRDDLVVEGGIVRAVMAVADRFGTLPYPPRLGAERLARATFAGRAPESSWRWAEFEQGPMSYVTVIGEGGVSSCIAFIGLGWLNRGIPRQGPTAFTAALEGVICLPKNVTSYGSGRVADELDAFVRGIAWTRMHA